MTWPWCYLVWMAVGSWFFPLWNAFHGFPWDSSTRNIWWPLLQCGTWATPLLGSLHKTHPHSLPLLLRFSCSWQFSWVGSFPKRPSKAFTQSWRLAQAGKHPSFHPAVPKVGQFFLLVAPYSAAMDLFPQLLAWRPAWWRLESVYKLVKYLCEKGVDPFMKTRLKVFGKSFYYAGIKILKNKYLKKVFGNSLSKIIELWQRKWQKIERILKKKKSRRPLYLSCFHRGL